MIPARSPNSWLDIWNHWARRTFGLPPCHCSYLLCSSLIPTSSDPLRCFYCCDRAWLPQRAMPLLCPCPAVKLYLYMYMFLVPKLYLYMYRWGGCLRSLCTPHHVCPFLLLSWVTNYLGHLTFWCKIKTTREFISSCCKWSLRLFLICARQKCLVIPFPSERLNLDVHRLLN